MSDDDQSVVQKDHPREFFSALLAFVSDIVKDLASSMLVVLFRYGGYCRNALVLPMVPVFIACRWVYCSGCHAAILE